MMPHVLIHPLDTGHKGHWTGRLVHLLNNLCTFNLRPVSRGYLFPASYYEKCILLRTSSGREYQAQVRKIYVNLVINSIYFTWLVTKHGPAGQFYPRNYFPKLLCCQHAKF